jgi:hypothetical protein
MSGLRRLLAFLVVTIGAIMFRPVWMQSIQPHVPAEVASGQAAPSEELARKLQLFQQWQTLSTVVTIVVILGAAWILLPRPRPRDKDRWPYVVLLGFAGSIACTVAIVTART